MDCAPACGAISTCSEVSELRVISRVRFREATMSVAAHLPNLIFGTHRCRSSAGCDGYLDSTARARWVRSLYFGKNTVVVSKSRSYHFLICGGLNAGVFQRFSGRVWRAVASGCSGPPSPRGTALDP